MQQIELMPHTKLTLGQGSFTVVATIREFQPLEEVELVLDGQVVGTGEVISYAINHFKDLTEVNFSVRRLKVSDPAIDEIVKSFEEVEALSDRAFEEMRDDFLLERPELD
jgi:hypothetical protein